MPSLVCVPIMVQDLASALRDAATGSKRDQGADLVEFRVDEFFNGGGDEQETKAIVRLVAESPLPCIVTCRVVGEGGGYDGDEMERVALYERLGRSEGKGEHPPEVPGYRVRRRTWKSANLRQKVDLAVGIPDTAQPGETRASLILSVHDMGGRPADLMRRLAALNAQAGAAVLKVAYRARSLRDSLELLDLPAQAHKPMIALGIGEFGLVSRVPAALEVWRVFDVCGAAADDNDGAGAADGAGAFGPVPVSGDWGEDGGVWSGWVAGHAFVVAAGAQCGV